MWRWMLLLEDFEVSMGASVSSELASLIGSSADISFLEFC